MRKETKLLFANVRPGGWLADYNHGQKGKRIGPDGNRYQHTLGRQFRAALAELDKRPPEFRIHGEIRDPNAKADRRPEVQYLLSRAEDRWGRATRRPVRTGKTAKDHRTGAWQQRLNNLAARAAAQ
jgi:hypothetical protein